MTPLRTIALVGIDGAGKTTQARWLAEWLDASGIPAAYWRNAGGRLALGRLARRLGRRDAADLFGPDLLLAIEAVLRWLAITWALLVSRLRGRVAVMDRYRVCQYASIRARRGRGERLARALYSLFPEPDLTIFLSVAPDEAQRRIAVRGTDFEDMAFLEAADAGYRSLPEFGGFAVVDGDDPAQVVRWRIRELLSGRSAAVTPV